MEYRAWHYMEGKYSKIISVYLGACLFVQKLPWRQVGQNRSTVGINLGGMIKVVDRYNITSDRISQVGYCKMSETNAGGPWRQAATKGGGGRDDAVSRPAR